MPIRSSRVLRSAAALGLPIVLTAAPLGAQGPEPGSGQVECCILMLVPVGARASALGGSIAARPGADAVFSNPAGLAGLSSGSFVIHHSDMNVGAQIDAFSLMLRSFSSTAGLSYQLFDKGDIQSTDPSGQPIGELSLRDHLLVASVATALVGGLSAGVNYKLFQQRIDCTGVCGGEESIATTHGTDLGLRYNPTWRPALELGIAVLNLGFPLQDEQSPQSELFPARLHVGAAYDVLDAIPRDWILAARVLVQATDRLRDPGSPVTSFGLELDLQSIVFLRAGYAPGEGLGTGAAVGIELRYDRFDIAVARTFVNSSLEADREPFQVTFGLNF